MTDYGPARIRSARRLRASSFDRTGGNCDHWRIHPGEEKAIMEAAGPGCIRHVWFTCGARDRRHLRKIILRVFWDGEDSPSVLVPLGDFFGLGHCIYRPFETEWLTASANGGRALNCWFPMPFADGARVTVENGCDDDSPIYFYSYIDYESGQTPPEDVGRFHAHWRREFPTRPDGDYANVTGDGNYLIADIKGRGQFVATILNVDSPSVIWYGEGDDMFFVDGEGWPPSLHGTGTEDYFNTAWCPREAAAGPLHGLVLSGHPNSRGYQFVGKSTYYRLHVNDPVTFRESLVVSIEHGTGNEFVGDWSSTAFWYQTGRREPLPALPPVEERLPLPDLAVETGRAVDEAHRSIAYFFGVGDDVSKAAGETLVERLCDTWTRGSLDEAAAKDWAEAVWCEHAEARKRCLAADGREVVVPRVADGATAAGAATLAVDRIHASRTKAPRGGEVSLAYDERGLVISGRFEIARREKPGFMYDKIDLFLAEQGWGERFVAVSVVPSRGEAECSEHHAATDGGWGGLTHIEGPLAPVTVEVTDDAWRFETRAPWKTLGIAPAPGKRIDCNVDRWNLQDNAWWASWALSPHHYYHPRMGGVLVLG